MIVTTVTRQALAIRREQRSRRLQGYLYTQLDWRIARGADYDHVLTDVVIATDGKGVWYKIGPKG